MKKILSGLLALVMIISCMAITVSASAYSTYDYTVGQARGIAKAPAVTGMSDSEWTLLRETNQLRWDDCQYGPLTTFSKLNEAAGIRAEEQTEKFGHTRPDGKYYDTVFEEVGLPDLATSENCYWGSNEPAGAVYKWCQDEHYNAMVGNYTGVIWGSDSNGNSISTEYPIRDRYRHMGVGNFEYDYYVQEFYSTNPNSGAYNEWELDGLGLRDTYCCTYTKLSIVKPDTQFDKGTNITSMNLVGVLTCGMHGDCYFPVLSEYCSGYDANKTGKQTVTVSVYGQSAEVEVNIKDNATDTTRPSGLPFTDLASNAWYTGAVEYVYENGLMNGVEDTKFDPDGTMTRGMLVTVLYRYDGSPSVSGKTNPFKDVASNAWFTDAVKWAYANGIVNGTTSTTFAPDEEITREQIVTIFYRYAAYKGINADNSAGLSGYSDAGQVADYARSAFEWSVANGIVNGTSSTTLSPRDNATRAQCATIIQRFADWASASSVPANPTEPEATTPTVPDETKPEENEPEATQPSEAVPDETEPEATTPEETEPTTHEHTHDREYYLGATCGADGYNYWECACGYSEGKITEATQKHTYKAVTVDATDTMDAYKYYVCTTCGDSTQSNYTCPNGCDYVATVIAPTKDSVGYTLHECTRCGKTKKTDFVHLNGDHEYITIVRRESGWKITRYKCVKCEEYHETVE